MKPFNKCKKGYIAVILGIVGLLLLIISELMLFQKKEPFTSWFYCYVWWSYIFIIDSLNYILKGNSLIITRTKEFLWLLPWSIIIWLLFELINIIIKNWYYLGVIKCLPARWIGYTLAYSTVLPGIFETFEFLGALRFFQGSKSYQRIHFKEKWLSFSLVCGLVFLIAPLIWPRFFFPLVWISFIFLLEPVNYLGGGSSLLKELENGNWSKLLNLLLAGIFCGILWEFWNYWAKAKWIYTIPYLNHPKVFEMPLAGYLGFAPFAVECYVLYSFITQITGLKGWEVGEKIIVNRGVKGSSFNIVLTGIMLLFSILGFKMIDTYTVKSFSEINSDIKFQFFR